MITGCLLLLQERKVKKPKGKGETVENREPGAFNIFLLLEEAAVDSEYDPGLYGYHHFQKQIVFRNTFQSTVWTIG